MLDTEDDRSCEARLDEADADADDVRLVRALAAGSSTAFDALYRRFYPRLTRFLDRMTRRPGLVEELLDDTMLVVWHQAERYNGTCKVSTWVFGIAYRKALKALQRLDEPLADDDADLRQSPDPGPEQQLGHRQLQAALQQALAHLSPAQRAVIDLTYFHGFDCREIAAIVECPVDTVKTRMFHARRRLRALLAHAPADWL